MRNTIKFNLANDETESHISDQLAMHHQMKKETTISGRLNEYTAFIISLSRGRNT